MSEGIFNVAALFVLLRESLEAALIVGVLLNYVNKTHTHDPATAKKLRGSVWWGAGAGLILSIIVGVIFTVIFYVLRNNVFSEAAALFEGIMKAIAVAFLTWMGFGMLKADNWYSYWEKKLESKLTDAEKKELADRRAARAVEAAEAEKAVALPAEVDDKTAANSLETSSQSTATAVAAPSPNDHADYDGAFSARPRALFLIAFTVVVREGLESVVFLAGIGQGNPVALILPGIVGIIVGTVIGVIVYFTAGRFRLDIFLKISAAFLFIIAAGLAAGAAHEFEEDYYARHPEYGMEETQVLWDVCACCSQKNNAFFAIMYALVGWRCKGTIATVATYFGYWLCVLLGIAAFMYWKKKKAAKGELGAALGGAPKNGVEALAVTSVDVEVEDVQKAVEEVPAEYEVPAQQMVVAAPENEKAAL